MKREPATHPPASGTEGRMEGSRGMEAGEVVALEEAVIPTRPVLHVGLYGEPHAGKSHFLAEIIYGLWKETKRPSYVACFDRLGKELTYEKVWRGKGALTKRTGVDKRGTHTVTYRLGGEVLARLGLYAGAIVEQTDSVARLSEYFPILEQEILQEKWASFALDSLTYYCYDARKQSQYVDNPKTSRGNQQHGLQWYGAAADAAEEFICSRICNLRCATFLVMHESKVIVEAEGQLVRSPAVAGKRLQAENRVASTFPELWRMYTGREEGKGKWRRLQTESDGEWQAGSIIGMPDGCAPTYENIWVNWDNQLNGKGEA